MTSQEVSVKEGREGRKEGLDGGGGRGRRHRREVNSRKSFVEDRLRHPGTCLSDTGVFHRKSCTNTLSWLYPFHSASAADCDKGRRANL